MTKARWLWAALVGLVVLAAPVLAQDEGRERGERRRRGDRRTRRGREGRRARQPGLGRIRNPEAFYQKLVKELNLDENQQKAVRQAIDTYVQALKNWRAEHGEELRALMREMREAGREDREKLRPLREKQRKLMQSRTQIGQAGYKQIMEVLNEDQKVKFRRIVQELNRPDPIMLLRAALRRLGLSEEDRKKADDTLKAAQADARKVDDP
ncbi:MAG: hypothetical protein ACYS5V_13500, partial [Planctomycetota bacterium]